MAITPTHDTAIQQPIALQKAVWEVQQKMIMAGFIGLKVMPIFQVSEWSDHYTVMPIEALYNTHEIKRKGDGSYNLISEKFEMGHYKTKEYGLEAHIDEREAKIYGSYFNYQLHVSTILMNAIMRSMEKYISSLYFPGTFTPATVTTAWTDVGSDPFTDIQTGKKYLRDQKGINPDDLTLVTNYENILNLMNVTKVIDAVKSMFPDTDLTGGVEVKHLEAYLKTPILVAGAQENTAKKNQDASLADIWAKDYAMLAVIAPEGSDITEPSAGRTFLWNEGQSQTIIVEEYDKPENRGRRLRVRYDADHLFLKSYDDSDAVKSEVSKDTVYLMDGVNP